MSAPTMGPRASVAQAIAEKMQGIREIALQELKNELLHKINELRAQLQEVNGLLEQAGQHPRKVIRKAEPTKRRRSRARYDTYEAARKAAIEALKRDSAAGRMVRTKELRGRVFRALKINHNCNHKRSATWFTNAMRELTASGAVVRVGRSRATAYILKKRGGK